jgi:short subunit dehydrogenase
MELGLAGKTALVTGGSKGIGLETARALAREGVKVRICARRQQALTDAANDIMQTTPQAISTAPSSWPTTPWTNLEADEIRLVHRHHNPHCRPRDGGDPYAVTLVMRREPMAFSTRNSWLGGYGSPPIGERSDAVLRTAMREDDPERIAPIEAT